MPLLVVRPYHQSRLLLALLLQAIYGLRSQRLLLEQLNDNMLYRWSVGLGAGDPLWHHPSFSKNRERLLNEKVMSHFLETLHPPQQQ